MIMFLFLLLFFMPFSTGHCLSYSYTGQDKVGRNSFYFPFIGQSLAQIGREHELGPVEMLKANSHISESWFLYPWQGIFIPRQLELPKEIHQNERIIMVILDELRVYARFGDKVLTYPVGVGKKQTPSPTGDFTIIKKLEHPTWYPPQSIVKEQAKQGIFLDKVVPAGPDNPLGTRGIYFDKPGYLIHGTNRPGGVGRISSAGCFRMTNEDVEDLFEYVKKGDRFLVIKKR